jgi:hypothetical protein
LYSLPRTNIRVLPSLSQAAQERFIRAIEVQFAANAEVEAARDLLRMELKAQEERELLMRDEQLDEYAAMPGLSQVSSIWDSC